MKNETINVINERYTERNMDETKKINKDELELILDAGRVAPSGFGLEPWKFIVISGDKTKISEACFSQPVVTACSHLVVCMYAKKGILKTDPEYISRIQDLHGFTKEQVERNSTWINQAWDTNYMKEQVPYAIMQMVIAAQSLNVCSTIMGGLNEVELAKILNVDLEEYGIIANVAFGYPKEKVSKNRNHRDLKETVEFIEL